MSGKLIKQTAAAILAGLLILPVYQVSWAQEAPSAPQEQADQKPEPLEPGTEVAKINGETVLLEDVTVRANFRPVPDILGNLPMMIPTMRGEQLEKVVTHLFTHDLIAEDHKEDVELDQEMEDQLEGAAVRFAQSFLSKDVLEDKIGEPTEEELMALYEEKADSEFKVEEEMRMRHIFVSTYVPYEVKEGDTLESIATDVSGDESMAEKILANDEEKRPRHEKTTTEVDGETYELEARALVPGEKLLVPADDDSDVVAEAREKAQEAYAALEAGENFVDVANEYSENEAPGRVWVIRPAKQERAVMEDILDTFDSLEDGQFSEPLRTKHGFQIVYREAYQAEEVKPFEEVETRLVNIYKRDKQRQLIDEFYTDVLNNEEITTFNEENLAKEGEEAAEDDLVATIGDREITRGDMKSFLRVAPEDPLPSIDEMKEKIKTVLPLQSAMVVGKIKEGGYLELKEVKEAREIAKASLISDLWLRKVAEESVSEPTDEEIQEYYDENSAQYQIPEAYTLYGIVEKGEEEAAVEAVAAKVDGVASLVDFQEAATGMNRQFDRRFREDKGSLGKLNASALGDTDLEVIRAVTAPGLSEPVYRDGEAVVYWVEEAQEEGVRPLEELRENVVTTLTNEQQANAMEEEFSKYEDQLEVELLVD